MTLGIRPAATPSRIEMRPASSLRPYAGNARTHSPKQLGQIADSIRRFGFVNPILVDADGEIIAGHGRLAAAEKLGLSEVPVLLVTHLTPAEKRAVWLRISQEATAWRFNRYAERALERAREAPRGSA